MAVTGSEVTTKRGLAPLGRCSALAITRRVRLQLSSAWPPGWGTGPQPRSGGQAGEVSAATDGTALSQTLQRHRGEIVGDRTNQALVARQTEDVVDAVRLAPGHELVPGKAGIGAQQDLDPRPPGTDLADDPGHFSRSAGGRVDVRPPELGGEQVPAAEYVQRQIAVAVVIAVEEPAFLMAVQRIIRGIEVEDDLPGRRLVRLEEEVDEQPFDRRAVMADLVIARWLGRCVLEPVQRALAGKRRAIFTPGGELACQGREHRVEAELIMVDHILIAERDPEHPLRHHGLDRVFDLRLGAAIGKTGREPPDQADRPIGGAEQQRAGV